MFGVYGTPDKIVGSREQWADAMGAPFLTAKGLALSLPAAYGQYVGALMLAHLITTELEKRGEGKLAAELLAGGVFDISFRSDTYQRVKQVASAAVADAAADGVLDTAPFTDAASPLLQRQHLTLPHSLDSSSAATVGDPSGAANVVPASCHWLPCVPIDQWGVGNSHSFFEMAPHDLSCLYYSKYGPLTRQWGGNWRTPGLARFGPVDWDSVQCGLQSTLVYADATSVQSTLHTASAQIDMMPHSSWAVAVPVFGIGATAVLRACKQQLQALGFRRDTLVQSKFWAGKQRSHCGGVTDMEGSWQLWVRKPPPRIGALTDVDLTPPTEEEVSFQEKKVREAAKWEPIHLCPAAFGDLLFPLQVQQWVKEGVRVPYRGDRLHFQEVPQYPWKIPEMLDAAATEADRMMACGVLVRPPHNTSVVLVSPWVVVMKGGKTRCCLGLHELLNPCVPFVPFCLPQFVDTSEFIKRDGYMAAFDLRDFFFSLHIHPDDVGLFGTRHPRTGELLVCDWLPFGYVESPHVCCTVSEEVAVYLRSLGLIVLCFVDDYWLYSDTKQQLEHDSSTFVGVMEKLGFQWAPHKHVPPTRVLVFLV